MDYACICIPPSISWVEENLLLTEVIWSFCEVQVSEYYMAIAGEDFFSFSIINTGWQGFLLIFRAKIRLVRIYLCYNTKKINW